MNSYIDKVQHALYGARYYIYGFFSTTETNNYGDPKGYVGQAACDRIGNWHAVSMQPLEPIDDENKAQAKVFRNALRRCGIGDAPGQIRIEILATNISDPSIIDAGVRCAAEYHFAKKHRTLKQDGGWNVAPLPTEPRDADGINRYDKLESALDDFLSARKQADAEIELAERELIAKQVEAEAQRDRDLQAIAFKRKRYVSNLHYSLDCADKTRRAEASIDRVNSINLLRQLKSSDAEAKKREREAERKRKAKLLRNALAREVKRRARMAQQQPLYFYEEISDCEQIRLA